MYLCIAFFVSIFNLCSAATISPLPIKPPTLEPFKLLRHNGPLTEDKLGIQFDQVGTLEIRLSTITGLTKDILSSFTNLENLTISYSNFERSNGDIFSNCCPKLKNLEIHHLQDFHDKELRGIGTLPLERLEILDQKIPKLKTGVFQGTNLKSLLLVRCKIEEIEDGAFSGLDKLEYLLISNNKLDKITKESLSPLKSLETLEIVSNGIEKFTTNNLPDLPNLTDIVIIREKMKKVNFEGARKVAPKLSDIFLIGVKGIHSTKADEAVTVHNWE